ncbi:MAG TPA: tryptophan synthase subunit alpha [Firmicutes bacterium]|nr:tryptophan synthase subunit alpha [Bacillota bacterium]
MTKIKDAFLDQKAFIAFITAGDPNIKKTEEYILAMVEAGADLIEIGIPFSDPIAEGPVIQEANERALRAGTTTDQIFEMVQHVRIKTSVPLVFMTYVNPIFTYGAERFFQNCKTVGINGIICPDLPFEEKNEFSLFSKKYEIPVISLIAPTSHKRMEKIASEAEGFIYCISSMGVTGIRSDIQTDLHQLVGQIKQYAKIPVAVGFGISTPKQVREIGQIADGVIVGSAIVNMVATYGTEAKTHLQKYVQEMKTALSAIEKN